MNKAPKLAGKRQGRDWTQCRINQGLFATAKNTYAGAYFPVHYPAGTAIDFRHCPFAQLRDDGMIKGGFWGPWCGLRNVRMHPNCRFAANADEAVGLCRQVRSGLLSGLEERIKMKINLFKAGSD
jgi:hypothetical protein